jgi:hypothetical protein
MMGRQDCTQRQLFYEFDLDEMVPADHLLRRLNVFVTAALADLHEQLKPFYSVGNRGSRVGGGALGRSRSLQEVKVGSTSDKRPVPESPRQRDRAVPVGRPLGRVRLNADFGA